MRTPKEYIIRERLAHHAALEQLRGAGCKLSGLAIWRRLRKLERLAHNSTTAQCNGEAYKGQPFREEERWDLFVAEIKEQVATLFGRNEMPGFFVNGDARGYALKLDPKKCAIPQGMHTDWGGYGILAAEIS